MIIFLLEMIVRKFGGLASNSSQSQNRIKGVYTVTYILPSFRKIKLIWKAVLTNAIDTLNETKYLQNN